MFDHFICSYPKSFLNQLFLRGFLVQVFHFCTLCLYTCRITTTYNKITCILCPEHDHNQNKTKLRYQCARPHFEFTCSFILFHLCYFSFHIYGVVSCLGRDVQPSCWCPLVFFFCCLSVMCCTYRLQRWAASVRVVGCGGATRPEVGESDWGCWDCAAASRTGCPNGLAVGGRQTATRSRNTKIQTHKKHTTKNTKRRTRTERCGKGGRGRKTRQKARE